MKANGLLAMVLLGLVAAFPSACTRQEKIVPTFPNQTIFCPNTVSMGNAVVGSTAYSIPGGSPYVLTQVQTAPASGPLFRIRVNFANQVNGVRVGLYSDNAGSPGTLLTSSATSGSLPGGWVDFVVPSVAVTQGVDYWLAVRLPDNNSPVRYSGAGYWMLNTNAGSGFPNPHPALNVALGNPVFVASGQLNIVADICQQNPTRTSTATRIMTPTSTFQVIPATSTLTATRTPTSTFQVIPATSTSTATRTPTSTITQVVNLTSTSTPTATTTGCAVPVLIGDSSSSGGSIVLQSGQTYAQRYDLSAPATITAINIWPQTSAMVKVGIYNGSSTYNWPTTRVYSSGPINLSAGLQAVSVPNIPLAAGTYWLAYSVTTGGASFAAASGSTVLRDNVVLDFPCNWLACGGNGCPTSPTPTAVPTMVCTPPPVSTSNQAVIYASACQ